MFLGSCHVYLGTCSSPCVLVAVINIGATFEVIITTTFTYSSDVFGDSVETGIEIYGIAFFGCANVSKIFFAVKLISK